VHSWRRNAPVEFIHANAAFERAVDPCDLAYFDSAALCAMSPAERRQVENGRTNAVGIIGGDKAKTHTFCQILDLGRQLDQAVGEKDPEEGKDDRTGDNSITETTARVPRAE
jgi:hypothetical protein